MESLVSQRISNRTLGIALRGLLFVLLLALSGLSVAAAEPDEAIFAAARKLGRGINLGNALEAPHEGDWGVTLKEEYFAEIAKAGFDSVRLPVKWSNHAGTDAPYTIDEKFFERVDWAIDQATSHKLTIIVNVHHYDEINPDPDKHEGRLAAFWRQISHRYRDRPATVYFELLNEPNTKLTDERWSALAAKLLAIVREKNHTRPVIIGPSQWNSVHHLEKFTLPKDDRNIIGTFHYYLPFEFTHQGAPWAEGADKWKGRKWGEAKEVAEMEADFAKAAEWSKRENRPVLLGEFGVYNAADMAERAEWTRAVVRLAEKNRMPWCYWEFCSGFGAYDPVKNEWRKELRDALLQRE